MLDCWGFLDKIVWNCDGVPLNFRVNESNILENVSRPVRLVNLVWMLLIELVQALNVLSESRTDHSEHMLSLLNAERIEPKVYWQNYQSNSGLLSYFGFTISLGGCTTSRKCGSLRINWGTSLEGWFGFSCLSTIDAYLYLSY